jgi:glycosyltransferase involved in cell wall biosynthesis
MKLSLIIPCYNESENIPVIFDKCLKLIDNGVFEVILVDNGSTDESNKVIKSLTKNYSSIRSIRVPVNLGYGYGILQGLEAANGDILSWTHADLQTDPADIVVGIQLFEKYGNDIFVKGRRYGRPIKEIIFTVGMSIFESLLLREPLWDINAQPTMFSRSFYQSWKQPPHDFSLDLYAYYLAKIKRIKTYRFLVYFGQRAKGVSSWNVGVVSKLKFIFRTLKYSLELKKKFNSRWMI